MVPLGGNEIWMGIAIAYPSKPRAHFSFYSMHYMDVKCKQRSKPFYIAFFLYPFMSMLIYCCDWDEEEKKIINIGTKSSECSAHLLHFT